MIKFKEYNFDVITGREQEMLDDFVDMERISETDYIGDAIAEYGDRYADVYWEKGEELQGYVKEAMRSGLVDISLPFNDLDDAFFSGCYLYLTDVLYENLYELIFNIAADCINKDLDIHPKLKRFIDNNQEMVEEELEMEVDHIDNNSRFERIIIAADNLLEEYHSSGELAGY